MANQTPTDICNQALDAAAIDFTLGDITEGTRSAQVCLRAYGQCIRQLLRGANWDFARKQAPLTLLADATGQTPNVGNLVPNASFIYEYSYPNDAAKVRFVPWNGPINPGTPSGNIVPPNNNLPLTTGQGQAPFVGQRVRPARFLIATDFNYPPTPGSDDWEVQGASPPARTVVLTNVKNAQAVYTALILYPSVWDSLFRAALVAYIASEIALPLAKDKKFGRIIRTDQVAIAKSKIMEARRVDGDEGHFVSDIPVDWINQRFSGGSRGWGGAGYGLWGGAGYLWGGNDSCSFADGSAY